MHGEERTRLYFSAVSTMQKLEEILAILQYTRNQIDALEQPVMGKNGKSDKGQLKFFTNEQQECCLNDELIICGKFWTYQSKDELNPKLGEALDKLGSSSDKM